MHLDRKWHISPGRLIGMGIGAATGPASVTIESLAIARFA
jgi:hypothetical protein